MNKIEWSDKFSVGISLIDEQHKQLIEIINKLIEYVPTAFRSERISQTLKDLTRYAMNHFDDEENILIKYDYPDYISHKEKHDEFKTKVVSYHSVDREDMNTVIVEYLKSWLIGHILKEDMKYKRFFTEKGLLDKITSMV